MVPELTIAIVLFNSASALEPCLRSIRDDVRSGWAEAIAVDNASRDESASVLGRELPEATLLPLGENRGFAAGANAALARAKGRYWLLLNPDVQVPAAGLRTLVAWMDTHPRIAIASPELYGEDGSWESPGRAFPSVSRSLFELSRLHRLLPPDIRGRILRGAYWSGGDQFHAGWVPGTAAIIRPEAARHVGFLRGDLFIYGEDIEWCWRFRRAGWRVGVCANATFVHRTSASVLRSFSESEREHRIAIGVDAASRIMYGRLHARVLAAITALVMELNARDPRRTQAQQGREAVAAQAWRQIATRRRSSR
jgi:GT2 family glycosyltransferase